MASTKAMNHELFLALSDANRLKIVDLLRKRALSVGALADLLEIRQPQVSKHLKVLNDSGLVIATIQHRYRIYQLNPVGFEAIANWTESFEVLWDTRLSNLESTLKNIKKQKGKK